MPGAGGHPGDHFDGDDTPVVGRAGDDDCLPGLGGGDVPGGGVVSPGPAELIVLPSQVPASDRPGPAGGADARRRAEHPAAWVVIDAEVYVAAPVPAAEVGADRLPAPVYDTDPPIVPAVPVYATDTVLDPVGTVPPARPARGIPPPPPAPEEMNVRIGILIPPYVTPVTVSELPVNVVAATRIALPEQICVQVSGDAAAPLCVPAPRAGPTASNATATRGLSRWRTAAGQARATQSGLPARCCPAGWSCRWPRRWPR